jgi:hypothetical protein
MRRIITTLLALAAMIAAGVFAQSASADTTATYQETVTGPGYFFGKWWNGSAYRSCSTQRQYYAGVWGQYGGWGHFIDGCTAASRRCPVRLCWVNSYATIKSYDSRPANTGRVTLNGRLRTFRASGAVYWWRDKSCADPAEGECYQQNEGYIGYNEYASNQCNGVREPVPGFGFVICEVAIYYMPE